MQSLRLIGIVPLGIGITLLGALWLGGLGATSLFFRIFGSFVALFFILQGGALVIAGGQYPQRMLTHLVQQLKAGKHPMNAEDWPTSASPQQSNYNCPSCGAPVDDGENVSPHGDIKCLHCGTWFNVFQ